MRTSVRTERGAEMAQLNVQVQEYDGRAVVAVAGEVDFYSVDALRRAVDLGTEQLTDLVLDLSEMTFMDSAGLGEIVRAYKLVSGRGGRLAVVCSDRIILRVFRVSGVDLVVDIFESLAEATAD